MQILVFSGGCDDPDCLYCKLNENQRRRLDLLGNRAIFEIVQVGNDRALHPLPSLLLELLERNCHE